jgi:hypothetical protein
MIDELVLASMYVIHTGVLKCASRTHHETGGEAAEVPAKLFLVINAPRMSF